MQERDAVHSVQSSKNKMVEQHKVDGDTVNRFQYDASGKMHWGSGAADPDVTLYRSAADTLKTDDNFIVNAILVGDETVDPTKVQRNTKVAKVALSATAGNGGVLAWTPGVAAIITHFIVNRTTATSGACTLDFGVATNGTTSSDNLIDGLDANATAAVNHNIINKGTNGKEIQRMTSTQYVTGTVASGTVTGLVGFAYIEYIEI